MQKALSQAHVALSKGEVPVGAIVVNKDGKILGRGYNKIEASGCQSAHAEVIAIKKACKVLGDWRLDDCWLYVTLEPCLMCFGLIQLSRLKGIVFGACCKEFGFGYGQESCSYKLYKKDLVIRKGLKEQESIDILKKFFKKLRMKRKVKGEAEKKFFGEGKG